MLGKVFSAKPCLGIHGANDIADLGDVVLHEVPLRRYVSKSCSAWSTDEYGDETCKQYGPAVCQSCRNISPKKDLSQRCSVEDEGSNDAAIGIPEQNSSLDLNRHDGLTESHLDDTFDIGEAKVEDVVDVHPKDVSAARCFEERVNDTLFKDEESNDDDIPEQNSSLDFDHHDGLTESDLDGTFVIAEAKVEDVVDVHPKDVSAARSFVERVNDTLLYIQKEKERIKLKRKANLDPQFLTDRKKRQTLRQQEWRKQKRLEKMAKSEVWCDTCDEKFANSSDLRTHNRIVHLKKDYFCLECCSEFYSEKDLRAHTESFHSTEFTHRYTGPIAAIQDEEGGSLRITSLENAEPEEEYKGELPPFHDNQDWMSMLFPRECDVTCPMCDAKFKHSHFMKLHLRLKHAFDWYQCPICSVWRTQPSELTSHCQEMHCNAGIDLECPCCKSRVSVLQFEEHTLKCFPLNRLKGSHNNKEMSFLRMACRICGEMLSLSRKYYLDHLKSRHADAIFKCDHEGCDYINVNDEKLILNHKSTHGKHASEKAVPSDPVICDFCGNTFHNAGTLKVHCEKEHNVTATAQAEFPCPECDQSFGTKTRTIEHIKQLHLQLTFACEKCGKPFDGKNGLMQHMMKVHEKESKRVQCDVCHKWLCDKEHLRDHSRTHTGEKPYTCMFCDKTYATATAMTHHRKTLHPESWAAEKKRRHWLVNNRGKDSTEYRMQCHLCDESRTNVEELRAHWSEAHPGMTDQTGISISVKRDHDGPYFCDVCVMEFETYLGLKKHVRYKHPEKLQFQFQCTNCEMRFESAKTLSVHKLRVHDVSDGIVARLPPSETKTFCEVCGKAVVTAYMKKHMKTHDSSSRPTKCTYCAKEFSCYAHMTRHRNVAHRTEWKVDRDAIMQQEGSMWAGKEHPSSKIWRAKKAMKRS